ncbi:MAG: cob(I)yrinic acid a,c-diamide adenosyltransferase [Limnochordia bacterium]
MDEGRQAGASSDPDQGARASTRKGLVIVHTGDGKGKTTAALGLLMRAWGRDMKVVMFQFIKNRNAHWGEIRAARKMGVELIPLGDGFVFSAQCEKNKSLALEGWALCKERILAPPGAYDLIILDEITYLFHYGWLPLQEVVETLDRRPPLRHVVMTGRYASQALISYADLVTEMRMIKHPFVDQGIKAQPGIEF